MNSQHLYLLALALTKGLGPISVKNLIAYCGSAKAVFEAPKGRLLRAPGIGQKSIQLLRRPPRLERAEQELRFAEKHGVEVISYLDEAYPHALKYIPSAPLFLFKKGNIDLNAQPNIALVGTRRATDYGRTMAHELATFLGGRGINIVSGLAYGIDITAHRSVLKEGGKTTAVLGHGLDRIYPSSHASKAAEMLEMGGLLTEYLTGTDPDAAHFPARNRIISGICQAVIVVEAAESGGALITAEYALEQNREVYAIPGRVHDRFSAGCNRLIRDHGAKLLLHPEELLNDLELHWENDATRDQSSQLSLALKAPEIPLNDEEARVLNVLNLGNASLDQLSIKTGIPVVRLNSLLLSMEFKELLKQMPGKYFQKAR